MIDEGDKERGERVIVGVPQVIIIPFTSTRNLRLVCIYGNGVYLPVNLNLAISTYTSPYLHPR